MAFQTKKFNSIVASMINWVSSNTTKITDFNIGSVSRTILEAVALELEELYYQLMRAVEEAIEEAIYRTFNFPRNPSQKATGIVRFTRMTGTEPLITIPRLTLLATDATPPTYFETQADDYIQSITGTATGGAIPSDTGALTLTVVAATRKFTRAAGSFITDGFDVGNTIVSTGFTTPGNNTTKIIETVAALEIVVTVGTGLVNEVGTGDERLISSYATLIDTTKNFVTEGVVVGSRVMNITDGGETQPAGVLAIETTTSANDTLRFSALTASASFVGGGDSYRVVVQYKDVSVQAQTAGTSGNVIAAAISILKSSISNINSVTNQAAFNDGRDEETDLERKARFALYIQSLARATKGALEYAARTVDQIVSAKAIDDIRATVFKQYVDLSVSTWTDITSSMRNPGDAAVDLFRSSESEDDALYIGASEIFEYVNMHLVTPGVIAGTLPKWEYYNGSIWTALTCTDGTSDGTGPLTQSGTLSFTPPPSWTATTITVGTVSYNLMWIRLRIDATGVTYATTPTGDWCSLPPGFGYVYLYCHDGSGDLSATLETSVESAVELYRGCGIIVDVKAPVKYTPTINIELLVASNYDPNAIAIDTKQAIVDWLNTKILGQDVYVAELYQLIMDFDDKAILNTNILECSLTGAGGVNDLIIPSSAVVRPDTSTITVTATTI